MVPMIMRKYQRMKCNLNNKIKAIYLSMTEIKHAPSSMYVNCTDITFICLLHTTEDTRMMNLDKVSKGIEEGEYDRCGAGVRGPKTCNT